MRYAYARCVDPFPLCTRCGPLGVYVPHAAHVYAIPYASLGFPCVWGVEKDHRATPTERGSHGNGLVVMFWWSSNPLFGQSSEVVFGRSDTTTDDYTDDKYRPPRPTRAYPTYPEHPQSSVCRAGIGRGGPGWAVGSDGMSSQTLTSISQH